MKDRGLRFLIAMGISVMVASFSATLFAQFAPPTAGPVANEVAAPISNSIASPIKQSAFGVGTDGTTTIPTDTLFQIMTFGSFTNSLDVQGTGGTQNLMRLESGNLSHKTGQILIDSDVPTQSTNWTANSAYSLDTDGPISAQGFFVDGPTTAESDFKVLGLETSGTTPHAVCIIPNTGEIVACPASPTVTLTANPTTLPSAGNSVLTWSSSNATSCTGTNFSTSGATSGTLTVAVAATTTYTITCTNPSTLTASATATVTLTSAPTVTFTASPTSLSAPGNTTLTWSSSANATSCTGTNFSTLGLTNGSKSVAVAATTTYTVTCSNAQGQSASKSATVTVAPGAPTATLTTNPINITGTTTVDVTWASTNAASCVGTNFTTGGAISGTVTVTQSTTRTYTVTCTSSAGLTATATQTVPLVPGATLDATPIFFVGDNAIPTLTNGSGNVTLTWSSTNATTCTGSGGGTPAFNTNGLTSGSRVVNISSATTFTVTCSNASGQNSDPAQQTVGVIAPAPDVGFCLDEYDLVGGVWKLTPPSGCGAGTNFPFDYDFINHTSIAQRKFKVNNFTYSMPTGGTNPLCQVKATGAKLNAIDTTATPPYWSTVNNYVTQVPTVNGKANGPVFSWSVPNATAAFHNCAQGTGCEAHKVVSGPNANSSFTLSCHYTDLSGHDSAYAGANFTIFVAN